MTHSRPAVRQLLDRPRPGPATRPRAELRRRPQHGAPHRPPGRRRSGRPCRRDRRRPGLADPGAGRDGCRRHRGRGRRRPGRGAAATSSPTSQRRGRRGRRDDARLGRPARRSASTVLVANLPYNVATPLVCDVLDGVPADRADARDGAARGGRALRRRARRTPAYGAVSVKVAYWATARIVGLVPASVFVPRPKVESALVEIVRHEPPPTTRPSRCSPSCARRSASGARCCAARSPAS